MNSLVGSKALVRLILRRDRIVLLISVAVLGLVSIGTASGFAQLYPTTELRSSFAATITNNPAMLGMLGPLFDPSIGGLTAWRIGAFMSALAGLMSLVIVIRHTRTEEETGRRELLGATVVGRQAPLSAALAVAMGANLAYAAIVTAGLVGLGLPLTGSMTLGLSFAAAGLFFAAAAAMAAQLSERTGGARALALAALGLSYMLRFLGDSGGENGRLSWLSWLSPIGWAQQIRPFAAGEQLWIFGLFAAAITLLTAIAFGLSGRRDIGSGILRPGPGRATASHRLRDPFALAWRLQSRSLFGWTTAFFGIGLVLGSTANSISEILNTSPQLKEMFARLGGEAPIVDTFLSAAMTIAGIVASAYAVQAALRLRGEEEGARAELVLATAVGRLRWAASHLIFAALGPVVLLDALGFGAGLAHGLSTGEVAAAISRALVAATVQLPAVWVVAGIAVALFGLSPRFASVSWAALAAFALPVELGPLLQLSQWLIDLSPFTHVPKVLLGEDAIIPLFWLMAIAGTLSVVGLLGLRRRDLGRA